MENLQKFYINGKWVEPRSKNTMPVINPATEEQIGTVAMGNAEDVDLAVSAANEAFMTFSQRIHNRYSSYLAYTLYINKIKFHLCIEEYS